MLADARFVHHRASHQSEVKKYRRRHSAMHKTCEEAIRVLRGLSKVETFWQESRRDPGTSPTFAGAHPKYSCGASESHHVSFFLGNAANVTDELTKAKHIRNRSLPKYRNESRKD